jgi:hypothetical protein
VISSNHRVSLFSLSTAIVTFSYSGFMGLVDRWYCFAISPKIIPCQLAKNSLPCRKKGLGMYGDSKEPVSLSGV